MSHPRQPATAEHCNYRTQFRSASLGTEEELGAATVVMGRDAAPLVGVVSRADEVLVEITKDVERAHDGTTGEYTIELRTTPTELPVAADRQAAEATGRWHDRTKALQVAIWAVENRAGRALVDDDYHGYRTTIINPDHKVGPVPAGGITSADKQATVGVTAAEIGAAAHAAASERGIQQGIVHPLVWLPWYAPQFAEDPAVGDKFTPREKIGYAMVLSAVLKLASIWSDLDEQTVNRLDAKNAWVVRPRTPPIRVLDTFSTRAAEAARAAIATAALPEWANQIGAVPWQDEWQAARDHIQAAAHMGGHQPPEATVNGEPAMLFEYRQPAPDQFPDAFWMYRRWDPSAF